MEVQLRFTSCRAASSFFHQVKDARWPDVAAPVAPTGIPSRPLDDFETLCRRYEIEGTANVGVAQAFYAHGRVAGAMAAAPEDWREFVQSIAAQTPEKPDYWSSCGQCERNSDRALELIAAAPSAANALPADEPSWDDLLNKHDPLCLKVIRSPDKNCTCGADAAQPAAPDSAAAPAAIELQCNEKDCREAWQNFFHKVRAEISYDDWARVWKEAVRWLNYDLAAAHQPPERQLGGFQADAIKPMHHDPQPPAQDGSLPNMPTCTKSQTGASDGGELPHDLIDAILQNEIGFEPGDKLQTVSREELGRVMSSYALAALASAGKPDINAIADEIIADYHTHFNFPECGQSAMRECITTALDKVFDSTPTGAALATAGSGQDAIDAARYRRFRRWHPRMQVSYWTGQWWEPLYAEKMDACVDALDEVPQPIPHLQQTDAAITQEKAS
jgi:hypothetical protein